MNIDQVKKIAEEVRALGEEVTITENASGFKLTIGNLMNVYFDKMPYHSKRDIINQIIFKYLDILKELGK
ncbi:MAG: hypothetical protein DRI44_02550 [Chlamydiae bacterium]|nr:MAG: hypothetical protein DRI44_02550 [Chlamydiota bacterium]